MTPTPEPVSPPSAEQQAQLLDDMQTTLHDCDDQAIALHAGARALRAPSARAELEAVVEAYLALRNEELRIFNAYADHAGRCGCQMNALMDACENLGRKLAALAAGEPLR